MTKCCLPHLASVHVAPSTKANMNQDPRKAQPRHWRMQHNADKLILKKASAVVHQYCVRLQRTQRAAFCDLLNTTDRMLRVWKAIHALTSIRNPWEPFQCQVLALQKAISETTGLFASHFVTASAANAPTTTSANMTALSAGLPLPSPVVLQNCQSMIVTSEAPGCCLFKEESPLYAPFTLCEHDYVLRRLRAADPDGLSHQALRNLPDLFKLWLLAGLNFVWDTEEVPKIWETAWVVPVLKPGKPISRLVSYTPISLISCATKVIEQMIRCRLVWFLERPPACLSG